MRRVGRILVQIWKIYQCSVKSLDQEGIGWHFLNYVANSKHWLFNFWLRSLYFLPRPAKCHFRGLPCVSTWAWGVTALLFRSFVFSCLNWSRSLKLSLLSNGERSNSWTSMDTFQQNMLVMFVGISKSFRIHSSYRLSFNFHTIIYGISRCH